MSLGFEEKGKLVDALLECPCMSDRNIRDAIVNQLGEMKNNVQRNSVARVDVIHIVSACLNFPDGFKRLLQVVHFYEGPSIARQGVDELWSRISKPHVALDSQRAELFAIAKKVALADDELKKLYQASLPVDFPPDSEAKTLLPILQHLWDIPLQPDKTLPILDFVERLARQTNEGKVANELRNWTDEIVTSLELGLQQADIDRMRNKLDIEPVATQGPPYLLVEVHPVQSSQNKQKSFRVEVSFWRGKKHAAYLHTDEEARPLKHIPALLEDVLSNLAVEIPAEMPDLVIEFFLPRELMSYGIDQWNKKHKFFNEIKLGQHHIVVVRSLDRAKDPELQGYWRRKWQLFQTLKKSDYQKTVWIWEEKKEEKKYEPLELYFSLIEAEYTCLGLPFRPTDDPPEDLLLSEILAAGIPVALWPRPRDDAPSYINGTQKMVENILIKCISNENLSDLPHLIQKKRQQAKRNKHHPANYLTLLWDDPDRLPLKFNVNRRLPGP